MGCGVPRPDTNLCVANVDLLQQHCRNLKNDYDDNGQIKAGVKPEIRQYKSRDEMLDALNKSTNTDPSGWANFKAYIKNLRDANSKVMKANEPRQASSLTDQTRGS